MTRKPLLLNGHQFGAREVIPAELEPQGVLRRQLLDQGRVLHTGDGVTVEQHDSKFACGDCGREFGSPQAVRIHAGRAHGIGR